MSREYQDPDLVDDDLDMSDEELAALITGEDGDTYFDDIYRERSDEIFRMSLPDAAAELSGQTGMTMMERDIYQARVANELSTIEALEIEKDVYDEAAERLSRENNMDVEAEREAGRLPAYLDKELPDKVTYDDVKARKEEVFSDILEAEDVCRSHDDSQSWRAKGEASLFGPRSYMGVHNFEELQLRDCPEMKDVKFGRSHVANTNISFGLQDPEDAYCYLMDKDAPDFPDSLSNLKEWSDYYVDKMSKDEKLTRMGLVANFSDLVMEAYGLSYAEASEIPEDVVVQWDVTSRELEQAVCERTGEEIGAESPFAEAQKLIEDQGYTSYDKDPETIYDAKVFSGLAPSEVLDMVIENERPWTFTEQRAVEHWVAEQAGQTEWNSGRSYLQEDALKELYDTQQRLNEYVEQYGESVSGRVTDNGRIPHADIIDDMDKLRKAGYEAYEAKRFDAYLSELKDRHVGFDPTKVPEPEQAAVQAEASKEAKAPVVSGPEVKDVRSFEANIPDAQPDASDKKDYGE